MSDKNRIEEGDLVNVDFVSANSLFGVEVLYTPQDTGDSWRLRATDGSDTLYNACLFERMTLVKKGPR